jgi:hypothetical protein
VLPIKKDNNNNKKRIAEVFMNYKNKGSQLKTCLNAIILLKKKKTMKDPGSFFLVKKLLLQISLKVPKIND